VLSSGSKEGRFVLTTELETRYYYVISNGIMRMGRSTLSTTWRHKYGDTNLFYYFLQGMLITRFQ
jgi:hypothetical protein